ncbi:MAG: phytoene/squalene synthase family protein [Rhizobiaceae bacterium]|nr:phytoene/squalene synthase family protein [Rhizobiaceae bacterium]
MNAHFQYCADYLRKHDYARYISCLYLEENARRAAFAIYAFNGEIDNIARQVSEPMPGEIRLQWWRDEVLAGNQSSANPIARALLEVIANYQLPLDVFERLLSARIFDLYHDGMADNHGFETYLGETRSSLFYLQVLVMEGEKSDKNYADACGHSGVFIGSVELLKALPFHFNRQQSYFPPDISTSAMPSNDAASQMQVDEDWLQDVGRYALGHYEAAKTAIAQLPQDAQSLFIILELAKFELNRLLESGVKLDTPVVQPSRLRVNWCLWRAARRYGS